MPSLYQRAHRLLTRPRVGAELLSAWRLLRPRAYLRQQGWFDSVRRGGAVDAEGAPTPWFTYPALHFLAERVHPSWHVFEYGAGHSTLWWAARVSAVVSVENDHGWYERMRRRAPMNVELMRLPVEDGSYAAAIDAWPARFDVVVIDGRDRVACARHTLEALTPDGVVVWDNADRAEYAEGYRVLTDAGFRRLDFWGLGPVNGDAWCTAVFYRPRNCLGL